MNGAVWDTNITDRNTFIIFDDQQIITYHYVQHSIQGSHIKKIGATSVLSKQLPLLMYSGEVTCATSGGQLTQIILNTHEFVRSGAVESDVTLLEANLDKQLALHR